MPIARFGIGDYVITESEESPAMRYGGTWEKLPEGYALWTATSGAGGTIDAGLPNIVGSFNTDGFARYVYKPTGPFYDGRQNNGGASGPSNYSLIMNFDASRANPIYGNSDIVQPPAYKVYVWKKIA